MLQKDYDQFEGGITIADLYPDLPPKQQAEAEYRMLRYLAVVKEIFEQICDEKPSILTELERRAMLRKEAEQKKDSTKQE